MKKSLTLLLTALLCLLLTAGCVQANLECGVTEACDAYIRIDMQVDLSGMQAYEAQEIRDGLQLLTTYYREELGYDVQENIREETDIAQVRMTLTRTAESHEAAFAMLEEMLTDESLTPFTTVSMDHTGGRSEQCFDAAVTLDADKILATANLGGQPKAFREFWEQGLEQSSFGLTLTLPASEIADAAGEVTQNGQTASARTSVRFDGPTDLRLVTRVHYSGGKISKTPSGAALGNLQRGHTAVLIALCVFAALAVCCTIAAVCRRRRKAAVGEPRDLQT